MKKKKFIVEPIAVIIVVFIIILIPVTVSAYQAMRETVSIYNVGGVEGDSRTGATVSTFDDGNNKCYVAFSENPGSYDNDVSISCVKRQ